MVACGPVAGDDHGAAVYEGSVRVSAMADWHALRSVHTITGNLEIEGPGVDEIRLPKLEAVFGHLKVEDTTGLVTLAGLAALQDVDDDILVTNNSALKGLCGLEQVQGIGGSLFVNNNPALESLVGLSHMARIEGALAVGTNAQLVTLKLDALTFVGEDGVAFARNPRLPTCEAVNLISRLDPQPPVISIDGTDDTAECSTMP